MRVDVDSFAALLLELHPQCTSIEALKQAAYWLERDGIAAAAAWARAAAMLSDKENPPVEAVA